jgi:hypothetical protein
MYENKIPVLEYKSGAKKWNEKVWLKNGTTST